MQIKHHSSQSSSFFLFVSLPHGITITLRHLAAVVGVDDLFAQVELLSGLPNHVFKLYKLGAPNRELRNGEVLKFYGKTDTVQTGSMLKVFIHSDWNNLYHTVVHHQHVDCVLENIGIHESCQRTPSANSKNKESDHRAQSGNEKKSESCLEASTRKDQNGDVNSTPSQEDLQKQRLFTALYLAAFRGLTEICQVIINSDHSVIHEHTSYKRSALHACAATDQTEIAQLLLTHQINHELPDHDGQTALDVATDQGACQIMKLLRSHKIKLSITTPHSANDQKLKSKTGSTYLSCRSLPNMAIRELPLDVDECRGITSEEQVTVDYKRRDIEKWANKLPRRRCLSAPIKLDSVHHQTCKQPRQFVARLVNAEEYPTKVHYKSLPRPSSNYSSKRSVHASERTNSTTRRAVSAKPLPSRVESAKLYGQADVNNAAISTVLACNRTAKQKDKKSYYQTKYHQLMKEAENYQTRPENANSRFRFWKTWLVDKLSEEELDVDEKTKKDQKLLSDEAYSNWLIKKKKLINREQESETSESDTDNDEPMFRCSNYTFAKPKISYKPQKKKVTKTTEQDVGNIRSVYQWTSTKPNTPQKVLHEPKNYIRAHKTWNNHKQNESKAVSSRDVNEERRKLLLDGITYQDWLRLKQLEYQTVK